MRDPFGSTTLRPAAAEVVSGAGVVSGASTVPDTNTVPDASPAPGANTSADANTMPGANTVSGANAVRVAMPGASGVTESCSIAATPALHTAAMRQTAAALSIAVAPLGGEAAPRRGAPALIAVAHGSRDPRSAATMSAVVAELAAARPGFDVRLAFLDLSAPSVEQVVDAVAAQGHTHAVVAPMLLGNAFHARVDLPGLLAAAHTRHPQLHLTQADVLGPDIRLIAALRDRVTEACDSIAATRYPPSDATRDRSDTTRDMSISATQDPTSSTTRIETSRGPLRTRPNCRLGIAVAAVGSSSPAANARTAAVARRLAALTGHLTEICFATTEPTVSQAISRLHARGADDVLVAPWFLAPGLLTDRLATAAPNLVHANVIGPHSALTEIIWDRYDAAVANTLVRSA